MQNISGHDTKPRNESNADIKIDMKEETYSSSQEDLKKAQNDTILKRIPVGAEATTVLVSFFETTIFRNENSHIYTFFCCIRLVRLISSSSRQLLSFG